MKNRKKRKMKKSTLFLIVVFCAGLSLLLYPTLSDYWNSFHQTRAIAGYTEAVEKLDEEDYEKYLEDARAYNAALAGSRNFSRTAPPGVPYEDLLNVTGSGIMAYIEIPSIRVSLPVYHGTEDTILQVAIGHLEGTSLPVGGPDTHCVVSGHRGLPSAKLLTDLDRMVEGDIFQIHVLNEVLTYEVDQIRIVEPDDISLLKIEDGQDLCTLVTCTPYGINSHRLLVRGHHIENPASVSVAADAVQIDPMLVAPALAAPILLLMLIRVLIGSGKKKGTGDRKE